MKKSKMSNTCQTNVGPLGYLMFRHPNKSASWIFSDKCDFPIFRHPFFSSLSFDKIMRFPLLRHPNIPKYLEQRDSRNNETSNYRDVLQFRQLFLSNYWDTRYSDIPIVRKNRKMSDYWQGWQQNTILQSLSRNQKVQLNIR